MKILYLAGCSLFLSMFFSCKKKDSAPTTCPFTVASLTATYKLTHMYYRSTPTGTDSEIIGSLPACKLDDLLVLNANGIFMIQDVGVTCSTGGSIAGSWIISGNTISLEGDIYVFQSFDCTNLQLYKDNRLASGDRTTYVYVKQ
jgi:hypothetical protein